MTLSWKQGAVALAAVFVLALVLVKPIGVSTQFVIIDGLIAKVFQPELVTQDSSTQTGYTSSNEYLAKSGGKYAQSVAQPLNYGLIFVLSMIVGGFIASRSHQEPEIPKAHAKCYGTNPWSRYAMTFIGGFIALFGARLASGCTSGHMMSGMMQTSISGYVFALAAFITAIPVAMLVYNKSGGDV
ncbi:YeeE/YedE thiosulfate transporter family protein [Thalassotalea ponticola]|uniref:YeeE/YedE thiosulfate transporter family protein n=1 Tax=Thalassotalea ponticola TaxID=1523392 RepID=UPI0025B3807E|nr:YeeE/YedE thiosulfate transporter family protein [Thalassotalea ponticola]MDN3651333.1 YeeE/YedE thiosulfate transporter family protein [Thalassotalea ponticola]